MIKIQIVEDDASVSLRIESIVHALGYDLLPAVDNSEDALDAIEMKDPDIILMDIDIHGNLDGIQVAENVKNKEIPIIFITGHDEDYFYNRAKNLQPVAYLVKPFNKLSLQAALETAILNLSKAVSKEEVVDQVNWDSQVWLKDAFFVKRNNLLHKINVEDIQFIQSDGNYCDIVAKKKHPAKISLTKLLEKLPSDQFIRIHQRFAIQATLIENIDLYNNQIFINGKGLPIGPKFKDEVTHIAKRL